MTELHINGNGSKLRWFKDPIAILVVVILQTISFTVFLTTMNATLNGVVKDNAESKVNAYTKDDARKDRELQDSKLERIKDKEDEMTRRTALLEAQFNELRARVVK
jgi:peptidoglycan hydrolase CwlO-like protein